MKNFKKLTTMVMVLIMITILLPNFHIKAINNIPDFPSGRTIKIGVLVYGDNVFSFDIAKSLKDIQKEKGNEVEFTLFDGKNNPALETELLNNMLNENFDLLLVNISGKIVPDLIESSIKKARQKNIPLIFFDISPANLDAIKGYSKSLIVNNDSKQAGTLQGKMIVDAWNTNKDTIDKNKDDILQYIIIKGEAESLPAEERATYALQAINDAGIKTQELASVNANWNEELARMAINSLFLKYSNKIEVIIAQNHSIAIGIVKALQRYGYNMGNPQKTIPIFSINNSPELDDLIKKGFIAGTVPRNPRSFAEILYTIGMNLVNNKPPLESTNYKFDKTGVIVQIPFEEPKNQNT